MRFLFLAVILFSLTACAKNVEIVKILDNDSVEFIQNTSPFKFRGTAFPSGSQFEFVETLDGRQAAWILGFTTAYNRMNLGFVLNNELCTTDRQLRRIVDFMGTTYEIYSGGVSKLETQTGIDAIPEGICFKRV